MCKSERMDGIAGESQEYEQLEIVAMEQENPASWKT